MFYQFRQNNSGGFFKTDSQITIFMIIEADNANDANNRAIDLGIYFNGVARGNDCECCGDRWDRYWGDAGDDVPKLYGESPMEYETMWGEPGKAYCRVFYKDGTVKEYLKSEN